MENFPHLCLPSCPAPCAIVGLLVCPRIDVILCRVLRFSFSFCLALPSLLLLPLLLSILPPLNHIIGQGRKDAVVKSRQGGGGGSTWFRWLRLLLLVRFRPTLDRPWDLFDFLFNIFATVFIFFFINHILGRLDSCLPCSLPFSLSHTLPLFLPLPAGNLKFKTVCGLFTSYFKGLLWHASHPVARCAAKRCCKLSQINCVG